MTIYHSISSNWRRYTVGTGGWPGEKYLQYVRLAHTYLLLTLDVLASTLPSRLLYAKYPCSRSEWNLAIVALPIASYA